MKKFDLRIYKAAISENFLKRNMNGTLNELFSITLIDKFFVSFEMEKF